MQDHRVELDRVLHQKTRQGGWVRWSPHWLAAKGGGNPAGSSYLVGVEGEGVVKEGAVVGEEDGLLVSVPPAADDVARPKRVAVRGRDVAGRALGAIATVRVHRVEVTLHLVRRRPPLALLVLPPEDVVIGLSPTSTNLRPVEGGRSHLSEVKRGAINQRNRGGGRRETHEPPQPERRTSK